MNIIERLEQEQIAKLTADRPVPDFSAGDTLRVSVKVVEGTRQRIQAFEGVCIGRKNDGLNSSFTVRKISYGEGVERVFPLYSTAIAGIDVVRRGAVRRAKLYYLRGLSGKAARIAEKTEGGGAKSAGRKATKAIAEDSAPAKETADAATPAKGKAGKKTAKKGGAQAEKKTAKKDAKKDDTAAQS